jgi:hypothetical protein
LRAEADKKELMMKAEADKREMATNRGSKKNMPKKNHLGAGAVEMASRRLPFERVAAADTRAADQQAIFDMGVLWRM